MLKTLLIIVALVTGGALVGGDVSSTASASGVAAEEFKIDSGHSTVLFRILHLDTAPFWGRFDRVAGAFKLGGGEGDFINVKVDATSVNTNSAGRDKHVKGQDFFAVKEFPTIEFKSSKVTMQGKDAALVEGELSFHGVTKTVSFTATHTGTRDAGGKFGLRTGWEADLTIKRSDFNVTQYLEQRLLGDDIRLVIALEGMK